jgi:hypothetical protein
MAMPARRSAKFGVRFGNDGEGKAETEKLVTFLRLTDEEVSAHSGVENPCVGGSIPPQATKLEAPLCHASGAFSMAEWAW